MIGKFVLILVVAGINGFTTTPVYFDTGVACINARDDLRKQSEKFTLRYAECFPTGRE